MTTSVFYDKDSKVWEKADEIIIEYHGETSENVLKSFLDVYEDKTVVLSIAPQNISNNLWKIFDDIKDYKNFKLRLTESITTVEQKKLQDRGMTYFFSNIIANTYEDFYFLSEIAGAKEIYIGVDLGFNLKEVKRLADKRGVKLRAIANYAMGRYDSIPRHLMFFIRPEDIDEYAKYIDTFELLGTASIVDVAYRTYFERKYWKGKLQEIIIGLDPCDLDSRYLLPLWGQRANCKRRCITGSTCDMCNTIQNMSKTLEKAEIKVPADIPVPEIPERQEIKMPNF